jgi:ABC-2 type transport system ATP-binding protein
MISVETKALGKRFGEFQALEDCTLTVAAGEVFGLLGPNGAGKTTLIRLLLGFMRPTSGSATVGEIDVVSDSVGVRRKVAYLPGDARVPRHMKASGLLDFFASMHPLGDLQRSLDVARRLELDLSRRVAFMSTGMRQKLALATVLGPRTPLLILDEPTANLDPTVRGEVLVMVREAQREGRTVVFSSHVLSEIEDVCDRAVFLKRGRLVLSQKLVDLRDRHLVRGQCDRRLEAVDFGGTSSVTTHQDGDGKFSLDVSGELTPVLRWLLDAGDTEDNAIRNLRIEPVRLRTVYDLVHRSVDGVPISLADQQTVSNGKENEA